MALSAALVLSGLPRDQFTGNMQALFNIGSVLLKSPNSFLSSHSSTASTASDYSSESGFFSMSEDTDRSIDYYLDFIEHLDEKFHNLLANQMLAIEEVEEVDQAAEVTVEDIKRGEEVEGLVEEGTKKSDEIAEVELDVRGDKKKSKDVDEVMEEETEKSEDGTEVQREVEEDTKKSEADEVVEEDTGKSEEVVESKGAIKKDTKRSEVVHVVERKPSELKIMYQGRDLLDLGSNIRSKWPLQISKEPLFIRHYDRNGNYVAKCDKISPSQFMRCRKCGFLEYKNC